MTNTTPISYPTISKWTFQSCICCFTSH